ncbi:MAG: Maf family protein, partial [Anaerolineae bacterium]|nr:Maf family protein [Anaerolineae bacterium]
GALSETLVTMRAYGDAEIAAYVASGDPIDKAGAYAIQHREFAPAAAIDGCFSGVMGFPLADVAAVLRAVGVAVDGEIVAACEPFSGRCCASRKIEAPATFGK